MSVEQKNPQIEENLQTEEKEEKAQHWSSWLLGPGLILGLLGLLWYLVNWQIAFFVLSIVVMILIHELGHFIAAKRSKMKVTEFSLGFGPKLWSVKRKGVLYGIRSIPAGAFVKIPGMYMVERDIDKDDEPHTFRQKSFGARTAVALAGPATHFVAAILIFFILFSVIGYNGINSSSRENPNWTVTEVTQDTPAEKSGLLAGDKIIDVNGIQIKNYGDLVEKAIKPNPGRPVTMTVERGGRIIILQEVVLKTDDGEGMLGIFGPNVPKNRVNPIFGVAYAFRDTGFLVKEYVVAVTTRITPRSIVAFVSDTFNPDNNSDNSESSQEGASGTAASTSSSNESDLENRHFVSVVGISQVGGQALESSFTTYLLILALFNIIIGLLNLLPFLPFDGGHVSIAIYEKIRSRNLKTRYHADVSKMQYITVPILGFVLFISFVALFRDITDPLNL